MNELLNTPVHQGPLHIHPKMHEECGLDPKEHVIVDRDSWENARTMLGRLLSGIPVEGQQLEAFSDTGLEPGYHFVYRHPPRDSYNQHDFTNTHIHIEGELTLPDLLEQFKAFLQATGFSVKPTDYIRVIDEEDFDDSDDE
jgi:hypothetical protein